MRFLDLSPEFIRRDSDATFTRVTTLDEADGVVFKCPVCFAARGGPVGTHSIICWRPRVPQTTSPTPGRWEFTGTGLDDLSLVAGSSSVFLSGDGCKAHFFVRQGEVVLA